MNGHAKDDNLCAPKQATIRQGKMTLDRSDLSPCEQDHIAACLDLSHELRTPANAILGQLELILSGSAGPLSSEMRTSLGEIQKAALSLSARIGDVVNLAEGIPCSVTVRPDRKA